MITCAICECEMTIEQVPADAWFGPEDNPEGFDKEKCICEECLSKQNE